MSRRLSLILVPLLLLIATLAQGAEPTMKAWTLYSWQTNRGWYYALLPKPGADHSKRWADLNLVKVSGWEALRTRLRNIRAGEHLAFGSAEEIDDLPQARLLEVPRTEIRRKIRQFSKERGFDVGSSLPPAKSTLSD